MFIVHLMAYFFFFTCLFSQFLNSHLSRISFIIFGSLHFFPFLSLRFYNFPAFLRQCSVLRPSRTTSQSHSNLHSGGRCANSSLLSLPSHLFYARVSLLIRGRKEKKAILSVPTGTEDPNSGIEFCTASDSVEA